MNVRKVVTGSVLAAGLGVAGLFGSATAFADVSDNGTVSDAHGFGVANHIHNYNGDHNGVGWIRSDQPKGSPDVPGSVSSQGGADGAFNADNNTVFGQGSDNDVDPRFAPISNKGGNKAVPQTKAGH